MNIYDLINREQLTKKSYAKYKGINIEDVPNNLILCIQVDDSSCAYYDLNNKIIAEEATFDSGELAYFIIDNEAICTNDEEGEYHTLSKQCEFVEYPDDVYDFVEKYLKDKGYKVEVIEED